MWPVNRVGIAVFETASVSQLNFISENEIYSIGVVAGENPNLHYVACSYHIVVWMAARPYENS